MVQLHCSFSAWNNYFAFNSESFTKYEAFLIYVCLRHKTEVVRHFTKVVSAI